MGFYLLVCVCFLKGITYLIFAYVSDINDRLHREQLDIREERQFFVRILECTRGNSVFERFLHALQNSYFSRCRFVALERFFRAGKASFDDFDIGEDKLQVYRFDIAHGIYISVDMDDIRVVKATHEMHDGIDLADMREKFISQSLAL